MSMSKNGIRIPLTFKARRPGDIARCWADPQKTVQEDERAGEPLIAEHAR
jgi:UDP-glucose 4-epimerase